MKPARTSSELARAAVGLEAELSLYVDEELVRPEDVFGSPKDFLRGSLRHRIGSSYQLPSGAVVYFDTGVIEIATPPVELERGCVARAGRSLWEAICFVRGELSAWELQAGRTCRLAGFSTHYNVSIDGDGRGQARLSALARALTYILPVPVMILATNRKSTGVGIRPRGDRIEVTADFTPDPALMIAAGSFIAGVVREVARWPDLGLDALDRRGLPRIRGFRPMPHTSRQGWLARYDCYPANPIAADLDTQMWDLAGSDRPASLRAIGLATLRYFARPVARVADPLSLRSIRSVLSGSSRSLLDRRERPREYDDVGRLCSWQPRFSRPVLRPSRFERIVLHALAGDKLSLDGMTHTPTGMDGWARVAFRRDADGKRVSVPLEELLDRLPVWSSSKVS
jgi:hypothetical protein